jgi:hypothetical protein
MGRIGTALGVFGLAAFLAALVWDGPIADPHGRRAKAFAWIVNGMIEQFGKGGSVAILLGCGLLLAGWTIVAPRG